MVAVRRFLWVGKFDPGVCQCTCNRTDGLAGASGSLFSQNEPNLLKINDSETRANHVKNAQAESVCPSDVRGVPCVTSTLS